MKTRKDYMANVISFNDYYAQFVTDNVKQIVSNHIGIEKIKNSNDPHFNDIPLKKWDMLEYHIRNMVGGTLREANGKVSLSDCICVAKQAARIIKTELNK